MDFILDLFDNNILHTLEVVPESEGFEQTSYSEFNVASNIVQEVKQGEEIDVAESVVQGSQQLTVPSGKTPVSEKKESKTKVGDKRKVEEKHENRGEKIETDVSSDSSDIAHAGDERGENVKKAKKENNTHDESGNEKIITRSDAGGKDKTSKRQSRVQVCFSNRSDMNFNWRTVFGSFTVLSPKYSVSPVLLLLLLLPKAADTSFRLKNVVFSCRNIRELKMW